MRLLSFTESKSKIRILARCCGLRRFCRCTGALLFLMYCWRDWHARSVLLRLWSFSIWCSCFVLNLYSWLLDCWCRLSLWLLFLRIYNVQCGLRRIIASFILFLTIFLIEFLSNLLARTLFLGHWLVALVTSKIVTIRRNLCLLDAVLCFLIKCLRVCEILLIFLTFLEFLLFLKFFPLKLIRPLPAIGLLFRVLAMFS